MAKQEIIFSDKAEQGKILAAAIYNAERTKAVAQQNAGKAPEDQIEFQELTQDEYAQLRTNEMAESWYAENANTKAAEFAKRFVKSEKVFQDQIKNILDVAVPVLEEAAAEVVK